MTESDEHPVLGADMHCIDCGTLMDVKRENYRYDDCGLPYVVLENVVVGRCVKCGSSEVTIPAIEELHSLIARCVVDKSTRLTPEEVRFLRKQLGLSGRDFAEVVGVTPESVSRWENGNSPIPAAADRLLRMLTVVKKPVTSYPIENLRRIDSEKSDPVKVEVSHDADAWETVPA